MFTNLFSIFDPMTSLWFSWNWLTLIIPILFFPKMFYFKSSKLMFLFYTILMYLYNEMFNLFKNYNKINIYFFITLFYMFFIMNFIGLMPFIFTPSSHLTITLPISLTIWLSIMIFGWLNKTNLMFAHLVPLNTPPILMSFMVMIETISNFIRPMTLAIRLSANMIAGHMLLCLLGSTGNSLNFLLIILFITQILLLILEMSVSMIQAYVFSMLSALYSNEI